MLDEKPPPGSQKIILKATARTLLIALEGYSIHEDKQKDRSVYGDLDGSKEERVAPDDSSSGHVDHRHQPELPP
jgi:hypothetical protein